MVNSIIFDYGEVISVSSKKVNPRERVAKAFGVNEEILKDAIGKHIMNFRTGKMREEQFWQEVGRSLGKVVPPEVPTLWRKSFQDSFAVDTEILDYISKLKKRRIKVAVLSNNIQPWVEIIRNFGGYNGFDVVVNSCEVGMAKPDPEIYKLTLSKLGSKPEETIFIDDRVENLIPAQKIGMKVILATDRASVLSAMEKEIN